MKNSVLSIILIFISLQLFGQISFEKGYFINNINVRIDCMIKNVDWKDNPKEFEYKLIGNDTVVKGNLNSVKEFGINGFSRFVRADVNIDNSAMGSSDLSKEKSPEWSQQKLFLKVLVEGSATLFYYEGHNLVRFFYSVPDSAIKQLIYKEYYANAYEVAVNNKFREQLWTEVRCSGTSTSVIDQVGYRRSDLVKYFKNYNECIGNIALVYGKKDKKGSFHLKIAPGLNYSMLSVSNNSRPNYNTNFDNQLGFRLGLEAEAILPFNKNKWAVTFEPSYQYFNSTRDNGNMQVTINYNSIEFPLGLRYYFFLNQKLKVFADAMYIPGFCLNFNSNIFFHHATYAVPIEIKTANSYAVGGGIAYQKLSAEIRYFTNRDIFFNLGYYYTDFHRIAFIFGYRIF